MIKVEKVVRVVRGDEYYSVRYTRRGVRVRYHLEQVARPLIPESPLFAFGPGWGADWIERDQDSDPKVVLECEAELWKGWRPDRLYSYAGIPSYELSKWWENQIVSVADFWPYPPGTILCSWVRPFRILEA